MRKLFWLLAALLLAFYAQSIWQGATVDALFVVRDGAIVALVAAFGFALSSGRLVDPARLPVGQGLTAPGALLIYTGAACTLAGGLLTALLPTGIVAQSGTMLWWLGLLLLIGGIGWRRAWQTAPLTGGEGRPLLREHEVIPLLPLLFVTLIGIGVRLLVLSQLPAFCLGAECERALAVAADAPWPGLSTPALWLARLLLPLTGEALFALRLAVVLLASLTIPLFYVAILGLGGRAAALLGALLLALSPWHSATDGSSGPWVTALLLITLALALWLTGYRRQQGRWALAAGLVLGLLVQADLVPGLLGWALLCWLLWLGLVALLAGAQRQLFAPAFLALGGFLVLALPPLVAGWRTATLMRDLDSTGLALPALLLTLFQQGLPATTGWTTPPALSALLGALTIGGLGLLARNLRHWLALWLLGGVLGFGVVLAYTAEPVALALLMAPLLVIATLAAQQIFVTFQQGWQRLFAPAHLLAATSLLLLLLMTPALGRVLTASTQARSSAAATLELAMAHYLATQVTATPTLAIFVPAALLASPSLPLLLDDTTVSALHPLGDAFNALYGATVLQDTLYLAPLSDTGLLDQLQALFPNATPAPQLDPESGQPLFTALFITAGMQREALGMTGFLWTGDEQATAPPTLALAPLSTLSPVWPAELPVAQPFTARWHGLLRVPVAGAYQFTVDGDDPAYWLTLQVDDQLIIDTSLALTSYSLTLAKGFYPIELTVRHPTTISSPVPTAMTIRWQRPDGIAEVIGGEYLFRTNFADGGLVGTYYRGREWQGEPLDVRKDPMIGLGALYAEPYSVRWQGKVGLARTGEYLFALLTAPTSIAQLTVDGVPLVDTTLPPADPAAEASGYAEGILYLTAGWHDLELRFAPDLTTPGLQLFWQPPGNGPTALTPAYLAPLPNVIAVERPLPALPATVTGAVGEPFALSQGVEYWNPQTHLPPTALSTLGMETQWRVGTCGGAIEQLNQPHGVAISLAQQLIYVADTGNRRVVVYGFDGVAKQRYQSEEWQEPFALDLIDQGFPVLLDAATQLLYDLNPTTGAITTRPQAASFYRPRGLGIDERGNLGVADTGGGRVVFLAPDGAELGQIGGPDTAIGRGQPVDVISANGQRWAITAEDGRLWQVDGGGSIMAIQPTDTLNGPHLATAPGGALWVSDPARRVVLYLAPTGQPLAFFAPPDLVQPTGIATAVLDDLLYLALVDSARCEVGLWRTPLSTLPQP